MVRVRSAMQGLCYVDHVCISPGNNEITDRDLDRLLKSEWFAKQMSAGVFEVDQSAIGADDIAELTVAEASPVIDAIDDVEQLRTYQTDERVTVRRKAKKRVRKLAEQETKKGEKS